MSDKIDKKTIENILRKVNDPEIQKDLVSLDMVEDISIKNSEVSVTVRLTTPACPFKDEIEHDIREAVMSLGNVKSVNVKFTAEVGSGKKVTQKNLLPGVKNVIAVASGKGGVGKSTVSLNLAVSLAKSGAKTGLLDADIYGPSMPLMAGVKTKPFLAGDKLVPIKKFGLLIMSIGFLISDDTALIWRGPMVHQAVEQLLRDVHWGDLDYLVVDLPPGTGDVHITLLQNTELTGAVIVSTPQDIALIDARKAIRMFQQADIPVLGIIENMSYCVCPECSTELNLFNRGGVRAECEKSGINFLGEIPIFPEISSGSDSGQPVANNDDGSPAEKVFRELAEKLAGKISVTVHENKAVKT